MVEEFLSQFTPKSLRMFHQDFMVFFRIIREVDKEYGNYDSITDKNLKILDDFCKAFLEKYEDLNVTYEKKNFSIFPKIFFPKIKDLKEAVKNAKQISGFKGAGLRYEQSISPSNNVLFSKIIERISDRVYITFRKYVKDVLILSINKNNKKVEMIFEKDEIIDYRSPEFLLCAYFAFKSGFKRELDLLPIIKKFVFFNNLSLENVNENLKLS